MTTSFVLKAKEGSSLTEAYDALRIYFPDIYHNLRPVLTPQKNPASIGGSGDPDYIRLQLDLRHLPPESIEELRPVFALLKAIVAKYTAGEIEGEIVTIQGDEETIFYV